jgi:hypothetical protein
MTSSVFHLSEGSSFSMIKPLVGFRSVLKKQLARFPFEKNVFLMLRFRDANKALSDFIIETLSDAGLNGVRADDVDWNITKDIYNPIAVLYCCKYGIALLDKPEAHQAYNPNVIYELGMMHCLERECLILRNDSLPPIPFDLIKNLYSPYRGKLAVRTNVQRWLRSLGLGPTKPKISRKNTGASKLERAAVAAPARKTKKAVGSVVSTPDEVTAAGLTWHVSSGAGKKCSVSWSLRLANKGERATRVRVHILFLDKSGFALEDHTGSTTRPLLPGKTRVHKETAMMSPDLAKRIKRAMATVSSVRR